MRMTDEEKKRKNAERSAQWRADNPDRARAGVAKWVQENPERKAACDRAYRQANLEKIAAQQLARREADPEGYLRYWREYHVANKARRRDTRLAKKLGVPLDWYDTTLAAQGGKCATCDATEPGGRGEYFNADHDHETGQARGLLCHECNTALRDLERMRRLVAYAESFVIR